MSEQRTVGEIAKRLAEPFPAEEVEFRPGMVKGNRALALAYVNARTIMQRLDDVVGVEGWSDDYQPLEGGIMLCRLQVLLGGVWVVKADVGGMSEQPDGGDRAKASVSDALKRAAVKFGCGRYLYSLPTIWADYDPQRKQFTTVPQLPAWALPKPIEADHFGPAMKILSQASKGGLAAMQLAWKTLSPAMKASVHGTEEYDDLKRNAEAVDAQKEPVHAGR